MNDLKYSDWIETEFLGNDLSSSKVIKYKISEPYTDPNLENYSIYNIHFNINTSKKIKVMDLEIFNDGSFIPKYLYYYFQSPVGKKAIINLIKKSSYDEKDSKHKLRIYNLE